MLKSLWIKLKAVELVLNTSHITGCDVSYWSEERHDVLTVILAYQLKSFRHKKYS